jgi:hypothetical protein
MVAFGRCWGRGFFAFLALVAFGSFASIVTAQHAQYFFGHGVARDGLPRR